MHRWTDIAKTPESLKPCVVTLGNFDGVHRGHLAVIDQARRIGAAHGLPTVAVTFEPHPIAVLRPHEAPDLLTPGPLREDLLEAAGIDGLLVLDFTTEFAQQSPRTSCVTPSLAVCRRRPSWSVSTRASATAIPVT